MFLFIFVLFVWFFLEFFFLLKLIYLVFFRWFVIEVLLGWGFCELFEDKGRVLLLLGEVWLIIGIVDCIVFVDKEFEVKFFLFFLWLNDVVWILKVLGLVMVGKLEIIFVVIVVWELKVVIFGVVLGVFIFEFFCFLLIDNFLDLFLILFVCNFLLWLFLNVVYFVEEIIFFLVSGLLIVEKCDLFFLFSIILFVECFDKLFDWMKFFLVDSLFVFDIREDLWLFNVLFNFWLFVFRWFEELIIGLRLNCFIVFGDVFKCCDFLFKFFLKLVFVRFFLLLSEELLGCLRVLGLLINVLLLERFFFFILEEILW